MLKHNLPAAAEARPTPASDSHPIKIVPKGLRSFDAHDADFFLELLPGPRDRDALPESIRFWKARMEETDPDRTCGVVSSTRMATGFLPRRNGNMLAVP